MNDPTKIAQNHYTLYKKTIHPYEEINKKIPNNYLLTFLELPKKTFDEFKTYYNKETNTYEWDSFDSKGKIQFHLKNGTFSSFLSKYFEPYNFFEIKTKIDKKEYLIKDTLINWDENKNQINLVRTYNNNTTFEYNFSLDSEKLQPNFPLDPYYHPIKNSNDKKYATILFQFFYSTNNPKPPTVLSYQTIKNNIFQSKDTTYIENENLIDYFTKIIVNKLNKDTEKTIYNFYTPDPNFHWTARLLMDSFLKNKNQYRITTILMDKKSEITCFHVQTLSEPYKLIKFNHLTNLLGQHLSEYFPYNNIKTYYAPASFIPSKDPKEYTKTYIKQWTKLFTFLYNNFKKKHKISLMIAPSYTTLAQFIWQSKFLSNNEFQNDTHYTYNLLKEANRGAFYYKKPCNKHLYEYDFNNFYAFLNTQQIFPNTFIEKRTAESNKIDFFGFAKCQIQPTFESNNLKIPFFKITKPETKILFVKEIEYGRSLGYDINILEKYIYTSKKLDSIGKMNESLLKSLNETTNNGEKKLYKLILNSLNGLLALNTKDYSFVDNTINKSWPFEKTWNLGYKDLCIYYYTNPKKNSLFHQRNTNLARYLALIALGRITIHANTKNLDVYHINTDSFQTTKKLPITRLSHLPGMFKLSKEIPAKTPSKESSFSPKKTPKNKS